MRLHRWIARRVAGQHNGRARYDMRLDRGKCLRLYTVLVHMLLHWRRCCAVMDCTNVLYSLVEVAASSASLALHTGDVAHTRDYATEE